jgi:hypothetical protein
MTEPSPTVKLDWEYEIVKRPSETLIILYKSDESVRGYMRITTPEELEQWMTVLEKHCSLRGL